MRRDRTSRLWGWLTLALVCVIFGYLYLSISDPDSIDRAMYNWASLFDEALARDSAGL